MCSPAALCGLQRYVELAVDMSHKHLKLGHFDDEPPRIVLHNLTVYSCVQSALDRRSVVRWQPEMGRSLGAAASSVSQHPCALGQDYAQRLAPKMQNSGVSVSQHCITLKT